MKALAVLSVVVLLLPAAAAHTDHSNSALPHPSEKPGSLLYGFDRAKEAISLALTFSKEKKAEKRLEYAQERLAEAKELSEQGDSERAEVALRHYSRQMEKVSATARTVPELQAHVNESREVRMAVLKIVMNRTPEAANRGLRNAIERPSWEEDEGGQQTGRAEGSERQRNTPFSGEGYISTTESTDEN